MDLRKILIGHINRCCLILFREYRREANVLMVLLCNNPTNLRDARLLLEEMGRCPASRHDRHAGSITIRSHIAFIPYKRCRESRDGDGRTDAPPLFFQELEVLILRARERHLLRCGSQCRLRSDVVLVACIGARCSCRKRCTGREVPKRTLDLREAGIHPLRTRIRLRIRELHKRRFDQNPLLRRIAELITEITQHAYIAHELDRREK